MAFSVPPADPTRPQESDPSVPRRGLAAPKGRQPAEAGQRMSHVSGARVLARRKGLYNREEPRLRAPISHIDPR
jgi:hypothetical protein